MVANLKADTEGGDKIATRKLQPSGMKMFLSYNVPPDCGKMKINATFTLGSETRA